MRRGLEGSSAVDVAGDGTPCANSLSGEHEAYRITMVRTARGDVAIVVRCAVCGVHRLEDFTLETSMVDGRGRTMVRNRTTRAVLVSVNGSEQYDVAPYTGDPSLVSVKVPVTLA